jgi:putative Holliday junction resolvase
MRILALDVGERRIGVAVSDPLGWTAQAHSVIQRRRPEADLQAVAKLVQEVGAERVVVGFPRRLDGSEGPEARRVEEFAGELANVINVPIDLYDERLTTVEAEGALLEGDVSRRRRRQVIDKVAAALILDGYLRRASGQNKPRSSVPGHETERT